MHTDETWLPITGYEDSYEVSDLGRVRSLDRWRRTGAHGGQHLIRGALLKQTPRSDGRLQVTLSAPGRQIEPLAVHRLVASAFLGSRPEHLQTCHNNGVKTDNRLSNLRYDTKSENELDRVRHGTHHNVNKTHCPHGHPYSPANTAIYNGRRFCKTCAADSQRARRERRRQAAA